MTHRVGGKFDIKKIEIKKAPDDSDIFYYRGVNLFIQNDYVKALEMFQKALKKNPSHKDAKQRIQEVEKIMKFEEKQKKLKKLEEGFKKYQELEKLNNLGSPEEKSEK